MASECANTLSTEKGDKIKVKILDINIEKERISLDKQLEDDPIEEYNPLKITVTGTITAIDDKGILVNLEKM